MIIPYERCIIHIRIEQIKQWYKATWPAQLHVLLTAWLIRSWIYSAGEYPAPNHYSITSAIKLFRYMIYNTTMLIYCYLCSKRTRVINPEPRVYIHRGEWTFETLLDWYSQLEKCCPCKNTFDKWPKLVISINHTKWVFSWIFANRVAFEKTCQRDSFARLYILFIYGTKYIAQEKQ